MECRIFDTFISTVYPNVERAEDLIADGDKTIQC